MTRFYVTMTWDNWPEGGSYGTVIEAESHEVAEHLCRKEMARSRADEGGDDSPKTCLEEYGGNWHVVDCFDLDQFIQNHARMLPDEEVSTALMRMGSIHVNAICSELVNGHRNPDDAKFEVFRQLLQMMGLQVPSKMRGKEEIDEGD